MKNKIKQNSAENGFALLLALIVLASLSSLLITLSMTVSTSVKMASYFKKEVEAAYLARGAVKRVALELLPESSLGKNEELERISGENLGEWSVNPADWSVTKGAEEGDEYIVCTVTSEDAKLPLKKLNKKMLAKIPGISPVLAQSIAASLKSGKKGNSLGSLEELLTIKGVPGPVYDGKDDKPGLKDLLTVYTDGKVYVNGTSKNILAALPGVDMQAAGEIEERVKSGNPFERIEDLQNVMGVTPKIYKALKKSVKVLPSYYRIKAKASVEGISRETEVVVRLGQKNVTIVYMQGG